MKKIIIITFLFFTSFAFSQQEASNWYFGSSGGIKFLPDGSTAPLPNSTMTAQHSCATISDANGNLLFYSNGENIWNRNFTPESGVHFHRNSRQKHLTPKYTTNFNDILEIRCP